MEFQHRYRDRQCLQPGDGIRLRRCDSYTYCYFDRTNSHCDADCYGDRRNSHCDADSYGYTDT